MTRVWSTATVPWILPLRSDSELWDLQLHPEAFIWEHENGALKTSNLFCHTNKSVALFTRFGSLLFHSLICLQPLSSSFQKNWNLIWKVWHFDTAEEIHRVRLTHWQNREWQSLVDFTLNLCVTRTRFMLKVYQMSPLHKPASIRKK